MAASSESHPWTLSNCCSIGFEAAKWVPVIFILSTVGWSYYAYVIQLCVLTVESWVEKGFYLVIYHILLTFFLWSYWMTVFTPNGKVPKKFHVPKEELAKMPKNQDPGNKNPILEKFAANLPIMTRTLGGAYRYCEKCQVLKPDRSHHCSVCGTCVLKMDHHCPWVNNCVSFSNYKHFVLFLGYSFLYCLFISLTSVRYFILFWKGELEGNGRFHILFVFFVSTMFAVSLVSLFLYHCYLVAHNRSTLEAFRAPIFITGPDKNGFNLGMYNNFQEVFGDNKCLWFFPIFTSLGDGVTFKVSSRMGESSGQQSRLEPDQSQADAGPQSQQYSSLLLG